LPNEEVTYVINIPLIALMVTIIGVTVTALFQLNNIKHDRRKEQERKEEQAKEDREEMTNTINKTMKENLTHTIDHFDDKLRLMQKDIDAHKEEIIEHKKSLESLVHEVLQIIKEGSAGAIARITALEGRVKSLEDRDNK